MSSINHISTIVKLLEDPKRELSEELGLTCEVRAQFSQGRTPDNQELVIITCWGNISQTLSDYYKQDDYLIIEGSVAIKTWVHTEIPIQYIEINISKVYPLFLNLSLCNE